MLEISFETLGIPEIEEKLNQFYKVGSRKLMAEIATFLITGIKLRTSKGKDVNGIDFEPYSDKYAYFRQKKGHPVDKVTLFFTGSMMSSMDYTADENSARIYFLNTEDRSGTKNPLKAFFLNEKREFFGMSIDDIKRISDMVQTHLNTIVEQR